MALPPITPTASFVERENDDPQIEGLADDLDIEMPGSRMSRMEYSDGIEVEEDDDGGVVVDFDPEAAKADREEDFYENLAENMDDGDLGMVANDLLGQYDSAKSSREDWEESYSKGLDLLGFKYQERTEPFRGATGVTHPLLAEAATQFQAQAFNEMLPPEGPVRTQVMGELTQGKEAQSRRVKEFMNYYITNVMEEYTPEFDQMLFYLPLAGSTFKKVYYDANMDRAVSKFVPAENLVVPYDAADWKLRRLWRRLFVSRGTMCANSRSMASIVTLKSTLHRLRQRMRCLNRTKLTVKCRQTSTMTSHYWNFT